MRLLALAWAIILLFATAPALAGVSLTAGYTSPGTTNYPDGGLTPAAVQMLDPSEDLLNGAAIIRSSQGDAFFGTFTSPGIIVRIDLDTNTKTGALSLPDGEDNLHFAAADSAGNFGYFAAWTSPARVIKVDLNTLTRVGAITMEPGENAVQSGFIDENDEYAYFGTFTPESSVVKVDLKSFTRVASLPLSAQESYIQCAAFDPVDNVGYFGCRTNPGRVVKVDLPTFSPVATLDMAEGEGFVDSVAVDAANQQAYFGVRTVVSSALIKVNLDNFTRTNAIEMELPVGFAYITMLDAAGGYAYTSNGGYVTRIDLSNFTLDGSSATGIANRGSAVLDVSRGYAWVGGYSRPGEVARIKLDTLVADPVVTLHLGDRELDVAAIDTAAQFAIFGTGTNPARVVKANLNSLDRMNGLELQEDERLLQFAELDPSTGIVYVGTGGDGGKLIAVDSFSMARLETVPFGKDDQLTAAAIDPDGGRIYVAFSPGSGPDQIARLELEDLQTSQTLTLAQDEETIHCLLIDPANSRLYAGSGVSAKVVRVNLENFLRLDSVVLSEAFNSLADLAAIDLDGQKAFFVSNADRLLRVDLSTFAGDGMIQFEPEEIHLASMVFDPLRKSLYIGTGSGSLFDRTPAQVFNVDVESFTVAGHCNLPASLNGLSSAVVDSAVGELFFGNDDGEVVRMDSSQRSALRATRITVPEDAIVTGMAMHCHESTGILRLGIYDDSEPRQLLWSVASPLAGPNNTDVVFPVGDGFPSKLRIPAGTYWLAWQDDSIAEVGSYIPASPGDGFRLLNEPNDIPNTISSTQATSTSEAWTQYIEYEPDPLLATVLGSVPPSLTVDYSGDGLIDVTDQFH